MRPNKDVRTGKERSTKTSFLPKRSDSELVGRDLRDLRKIRGEIDPTDPAQKILTRVRKGRFSSSELTGDGRIHLKSSSGFSGKYSVQAIAAL